MEKKEALLKVKRDIEELKDFKRNFINEIQKFLKDQKIQKLFLCQIDL